MTEPPADWHRVKEILADALELLRGERSGFLDTACGGDPGLRAEVDRLLECAEDTQGILDEPNPATLPGIADLPSRLAGTRLGRYRLGEVIGEGGMGVVYEAEQEQPRRSVALKLVRPAFLSEATLRRFSHEIEILGRLRHPAIAQIYEAGVHEDETGSAIPYFAMERVEGVTLGEWARTAAPSLEARLEMFITLCDAVQHAHQRGIIHRDLKPGNILVDEAGQPKILDFGIARMTDPEAGVTAPTRAGQVMGTLPYMSPEQASGDAGEIDTRADVYALGVLLYELLAGRLPLDLENRTLSEAMRAIHEEEPARLGTLDPRFRGDLETLTAKALAKDRSRRYASASELAGDVRRFLHHEPIHAREPSGLYHLGRFVRRHRALVAALAVVVVVVAAGAVASSIGFFRASRERDHARESERRLLAVNDFLKDILASAHPDSGRRETRVSDILDDYRHRIDRTFARDPLTRAELHSTFGWTYYGLGDLVKAEAHLGKACDLFEKELGGSAQETLDTRTRLGGVLLRRDDLEAAGPLVRENAGTALRTLGPEDPSTLAARRVLAELLQMEGDLPGAEDLLRKVIAASMRVLGPEADATLRTMNQMVNVLLERQAYGEALPLLEELIQIRSKALRPDHPRLLILGSNRALVLWKLGRLEEADRAYDSIVASGAKTWGPDHDNTLDAKTSRISVLTSLGRHEAALALNRDVLDRRKKRLGEDHASTLLSLNQHAWLLLTLNRNKEAEPYARRAVELIERIRGPDHHNTWTAKQNLAAALNKLGRLEEAEPLLEDLARRFRRTFGPGRPATLIVENNLAMLRFDQERFAEAAKILQRLVATALQEKDLSPELLLALERNLGRCLTRLGRYTRAEHALLSSWKRARALSGRPAAPAARTALFLAELYEAWNRKDEAETWRGRSQDKGGDKARENEGK